MDMETFDDISVMAGTLWGEARSEGEQGMIAVGNVIMNGSSKSLGMEII